MLCSKLIGVGGDWVLLMCKGASSVQYEVVVQSRVNGGGWPAGLLAVASGNHHLRWLVARTSELGGQQTRIM
jgi:hypothetical protein